MASVEEQEPPTTWRERVAARVHVAWRLYGDPRRLAAAGTKAGKLLRQQGLRRLVSTSLRKLRTPQMPVSLLASQEQAQGLLEYEHRWVLVGRGLSRLHSVSVIIPTKGNSPRLITCLDSIGKSVLPESDVDFIVINNGPPLGTLPNIRHTLSVRTESVPFNWSAYNNHAAFDARGEYLLFLNDDVTALHGGWLDAMLSEATREGTGVVGAKLLYPNGRIQHIGISLDAGPEGGHEHKFEDRHFAGLRGQCLAPRVVDAATGACLLTPKHLFVALQGFDAQFAESYNDVDYCLRLRAKGYLTIVTPYAELVHAESMTRPLRVLGGERRLFRSRWLATSR